MLDPLWFQRLYNDPKFQGLTLGTQQFVRDKYFKQQIVDDPKYASLSPGAQQFVYDKYVTKAAPAFQNPDFYGLIGNGNFMNAVLAPFISNSLIAKGVTGAAHLIDLGLKDLGVVSNNGWSIWDSIYSPDAVKLTQYAAGRMGQERLPYTMATVGDIADWIGMSGLGSLVGLGGKGLGITSKITGGIERTVAGDVGKGLGARIGRWVATGNAGLLGVPEGTATFANTAMNTAMREYLIKNLGSQAVRSSGFGLLGLAKEEAQKLATPGIPWAPGLEQTARGVARTFGQYAAFDFLLNTGKNALVPFLKNTWGALRGGKGWKGMGTLQELAGLSPAEASNYIQQLKLGAMDPVVWEGMPLSVRDHLTALFEFDKVAAGGIDAVSHDPVELMKAVGFMTGHEVVDGAEAGTFRIRTAPGTDIEKVIAGNKHVIPGGSVLADGVRLLEVHRVIAERFQEAQAGLLKDIEGLAEHQAHLVDRLAKLGGSAEELAKAADLRQRIAFVTRALEGKRITLAGRLQLEPFIRPVIDSVERARVSFMVELKEGALPAANRTAITSGEAAAVQAIPRVRTARFLVDLPEGRVSGRDIRISAEGFQASVVKDVKDFFVKTSDPYTVTRATGNYNGLLAYSNPASERVWQQTLKDVEHLTSSASKPELAQARLLSRGYDAIEHADGTVTALIPRTQIKHVSDMIDVRKGTYRAGVDVGRPAAVVRTREGLSPGFAGSIGKDLHIKESLKLGVLDNDLSASSKGMVALLRTVYGDVRQPVIQRVAELFFKTRGLAVPKGFKVKVLRDLKLDKISYEASTKTLFVPARIETTQDQFTFIRKFGEVLGEQTTPAMEGTERAYAELTRAFKEWAPEKRTANQAFIESVQEGYARIEPGMMVEAGRVRAGSAYKAPVPEAGELAKRKWLGDVLARQKNATLTVPDEQGATTITYSNGRTYTSNIIDDLIDDYLVENTSEVIVRSELADEGLRLFRTGKEGNWFQVQDGQGRLVAQEETIGALLREMDWRPSRIDSIYAPTSVEIAPGAVEFKVEGDHVIGNVNDIFKFMDKHVDVSTLEGRRVLLRSDVGRLARYADSSLEVEIPAWGVRKKFTGPQAMMEARQYLSGGYQEWVEVERLAGERGMLVRLEEGKYKLMDERGTYWAKDKDEVGAILARRPDPAYAPALIPGVPEAELAKYVQSFKESVMPQVWAVPADFSRERLGRTSGSQVFRPRHDWLITVAKKSGAFRLVELYGQAERDLREAMRQTNLSRSLFHSFVSEGGKAFPADKLKGIKAWLEAADEPTQKLAVEEFGLESKHLASARSIRDFLGTDPMKNPGLFGKFGVDSNEFLFGYLPVIKAKALELGYGPGDLLKLNDADTEVLIGKALGVKENLPKSLSFWAEKERLSELVDFSKEEDLIRLVEKYIDRGNRKFYLNETWKGLDEYVKNLPVGDIIRTSMEEYRQMLMGTWLTGDEKFVKQIGRDLMHRLGAKDPRTGENLAELLSTMNTFTTQSFRVWLSVRNMTQIYTTTGAFLGNEWVHLAGKELAAPGAMLKEIELLEQRGSITEGPPLLHPILESETAVGRALGKATEVGMRPMKRTDSATRAWAYRAAEMKWDWAMKRTARYPGASFEEASGVNLLHDDVAGQVRAFLKDGSPEKIAAARHLYSDDVMRLTMFDYGKANMATMSHGILGRLFGQYQVYPVYYVNLLLHMFGHGTGLQKAGMLARLAGNAAAIAGSLQLMGVDGRNMLPWVPAQMTGGPLFNLVLQMMWAWDTTSYRGRQARGELVGTLGRLVPGSYEWRMVSGFLRYMSEGKPLQALYAATSTPIRPDLR